MINYEIDNPNEFLSNRGISWKFSVADQWIAFGDGDNMPLINCGECGREISDQAKNCPGCGAPLANAKPQTSGCLKTIAGFIAFVLLIIFIAHAFGPSKPEPNNAEKPNALAGEVTPKPGNEIPDPMAKDSPASREMDRKFDAAMAALHDNYASADKAESIAGKCKWAIGIAQGEYQAKTTFERMYPAPGFEMARIKHQTAYEIWNQVQKNVCSQVGIPEHDIQ